MRLSWTGVASAVLVGLAGTVAGALIACAPAPLNDTGTGSGATGSAGDTADAGSSGSTDTGAPACATVDGYANAVAVAICNNVADCQPDVFMDVFGSMAECVESNTQSLASQEGMCEFDAGAACQCTGLAGQLAGMCMPSPDFELQFEAVCGMVWNDCVADSGKDWGDGDGDVADWGDGDGDVGEDVGDGDGDCASLPPGGMGQLGDWCAANDDCSSNLCLSFDDVPADPNAQCEVTPASCRTRITATVTDLESGAPVPGATAVYAGAIAASVNPTNIANPDAIAASDMLGRVDVTTAERIEQPVAEVAVVEAAGFALTSSNVAVPVSGNFYGPGVDWHEHWAVREASVDAWSAMLQMDPTLAGELPLVERGGVVALVRDAVTGAPRSGFTLRGEMGSSAAVRYLEAGGTFAGLATGASGIVVVLGPGLGESFEAWTTTGQPTNVVRQAMSAPNAINVMVFDVD